ncbi:hypothetical protein GGX14DRAFT_378904, partial [Mycena pura]
PRRPSPERPATPSSPPRREHRQPRRRRADELPLARQPYVEPAGRHLLDRMDVNCSHCHVKHWIEERVSTSSQVNPKFGMCCNHGKVIVDTLEDAPQELRALFEGDSAQAKEFRKNIAQYNTALSFTSLGVREDHSVNDGRGPPTFRIHGELCHRIGTLLPAEGATPIYAQLYIHDPQVALNHRMNSNTNLRRDTMEVLQRVVTANHQYAPLFVHANQVLTSAADDRVACLRVSPGVHARRGNLPTADEVAVVIPDQNNTDSRDIILRRHNGALLRISDLHPAYTPLYYVLLFPYGENGWHSGLRLEDPEKDNPGRLSQTRYVAYRLQQRDDEATTLLRGGRLLQRYMVTC